MQKRWPTYNDGVLDLYTVKSGAGSSFGAKKNVDAVDDMDHVARAFFSVASVRKQDVEFSDALGFKLSMKVKTLSIPGMARAVDAAAQRNEFKAVISGHLYNVRHFDAGTAEMWLYLEGVKEIG